MVASLVEAVLFKDGLEVIALGVVLLGRRTRHGLASLHLFDEVLQKSRILLRKVGFFFADLLLLPGAAESTESSSLTGDLGLHEDGSSLKCQHFDKSIKL